MNKSICQASECARAVERPKYGLCEKHYYRLRRNGFYGLKPVTDYKVPVRAATGEPVSGICQIEGCRRVSKRWAGQRRVCPMHGARFGRHGHFEQTRKWSPRNGNRRKCAVPECLAMEDGACGYCKMHMTRLSKHGDPHHHIPRAERNFPRGPDHHFWTGENVSYSGVHLRLRATRGSASAHECIDCNRVAQQWSYDRKDSAEKQSEFGPYSADLNHYEPRCISCHKRFDLGAVR